jgi:hypothetical protein
MIPRVHVYATCWNDVRQLEFFFRHYDPHVERYVIFDDGSTDGSWECLTRHPKVEARRFVWTHTDSFVLSELDLFNNCWKESRGENGRPRADWVIVCSLDEHLVHSNLATYLANCLTSGITVIPALGFQMFMENFPQSGEHLCQIHHWGVADPYDCKLTLFSPTAIREINYEPGGHVAAPVGRILAPTHDELVLRHYQLLGIDYTLARFGELRARMGPVDRAQSWGVHYDQSSEELRVRWSEYRTRVVDTSANLSYSPPEWWDRFPRS